MLTAMLIIPNLVLAMLAATFIGRSGTNKTGAVYLMLLIGVLLADAVTIGSLTW